jgi:hypothetical protein
MGIFQFDVRLIVLAVAVLILICSELGFRYGHRRADRLGAEESVGAILAAAFGVVALLLAFSFQLAVTRYDVRRETVVREANAIGTTILRAQLLDAPTRAQMLPMLRQYVASRIAFSEAGADAAGRTSADVGSDRLQRQMWTLAMSAAQRDPHSTLMPLFIATLNDTIDVSAEQSAALAAAIPAPILFVLLIIVLVSAVLLGIDFGRQGQRGIMPTLLFAFMLALSIYIILDLDLPQRGLIKVNLAPLTQLQSLF